MTEISGLVRLLIGILIAMPTGAVAGDLAPPEAYSTISEIRNVSISPSGNFVAYQHIENAKNQILVLDMSSGNLVFHTRLEKKSYLHSIQFVNDEYVVISYHTPRPGPRAGPRTGFLDLKEATVQRNFISRAPLEIVGVAPELAAIYVSWDRGSLVKYFVENGQHSPSLASGSSDTVDWYISNDREPLVREDFDPNKDRHVIYAYRNAEASILVDESFPSRDINVVALAPQQDKLIYFTRLPNFDRMTYHMMSLTDGSRSDPVFSQYIGRVLVDSGKTAFGFERDEFPAYEYEFLNKKAESYFRSIEKSLPGMQVRLIASTDDFQHMVVRVNKNWGTAHYLFFSKGTPKPIVIGEEDSRVSAAQAMPRKMLEFSASDGRAIRAYLTLPTGMSAADGAPLIVLSNGSQYAYQSRLFQWLAQYLASRGFAVVQPVFRDGDYSWDFMPKSDLSWGGKFESDIDDTVQHLVDQGVANPARICIVGFDIGGYAALAATARSPESYRCVASIGGLTELQDVVRRARRQQGRYPQFLRYVEARFGIAANDKTLIDDKSPITHVDLDFPPVLLMYFKRGDFMLKDQAKDMRRALKRKGRDVTLLEIPGYDFLHSEREARPKVLKAVSDFIEEHL